MKLGLKIRIGGRGGGAWIPQIINELIALPFSTTQINLTVNYAGTDEDGYSWERSVNGGESYTIIGITGNGVKNYSDTGLSSSIWYYYRVRAFKGSVYSTYSNIATQMPNEPWFLAKAILPSNAIAAYEPATAASLAISYINQANPGTFDAVPYNVGDPPVLDGANGWDFDGDSQYLKTGVIPENDQTWSMLVEYSDYVSGNNILAGTYQASKNSFHIQRKTAANATTAYNGGVLVTTHTATTGGTIMINGDRLYVNWDLQLEGAFVAPDGVITIDIWIGCLNNSGVAQQYFPGKIKRVVIYDIKLVDNQLIKLKDLLRAQTNANLMLAIKYLYYKLGALICYNMPTFTNDEVAAGNLNPNTFAPTGLDIDQWLDTCSSAKINRAILTVKAPDGFLLWPSAQHADGYLPYTIAQTTWYANNGNEDITKTFVDGCRARGIHPGLYFSIWDKTHEIRTGTDETSDAPGYLAMIQEQLTELLTNYGDIHVIWLDAWVWHMGYEEIPFATIYNFIKGIQPNCVVIDLRGVVSPPKLSDVEVWENPTGRYIPANNDYPAEDVDTIRIDTPAVKWYYHPGLAETSAYFKSGATLKAAVDQSVARYGCYLLGIQPNIAGVLPSAMVDVIEDLGELM